jgi:hypothetical protein
MDVSSGPTRGDAAPRTHVTKRVRARLPAARADHEGQHLAPRRAGVGDVLDRVDGVGFDEAAAVVNCDALAKAEGPGDAVGGGGPLLGEVGHGDALLVELDEAVVESAEVLVGREELAESRVSAVEAAGRAMRRRPPLLAVPVAAASGMVGLLRAGVQPDRVSRPSPASPAAPASTVRRLRADRCSGTIGVMRGWHSVYRSADSFRRHIKAEIQRSGSTSTLDL